MLKTMIGKKVGMTRLFLDGGRVIPVTVLEVGPCTITQLKTQETDKYEAVQIGFGDKKPSRVNKPLTGHFAKSGSAPKRVLREVQAEAGAQLELGQTFTAEVFNPGDKVHVIGQTKGRGFTGVVKRHGFGGGRDTHGCTTHDKPGSIGASATPSHVLKGKRMPGQYGDARQTVKNLQVVDVRPEENLVVVKGAVPGANGGIVMISKVK